MAVVKLTKSKKAVQFIDEFGNVFQTSTVMMAMLLQDKTKGDFIKLNRLPFKVSTDRFGLSEVWNPDGLPIPDLLPGDMTAQNDALSKKTRQAKEKKKVYVDKVV